MPIQEKDCIRHLDFIEWEDPYAYLEDISGQIFKTAVINESAIIENLLTKINDNDKNKWFKAFDAVSNLQETYYTYMWNNNQLEMNEKNRTMPSLKIKNLDTNTALHINNMRGFDINNKTFLTICDYSDGMENLTLNLYNSKLKKLLTVSSVGETATADETHLYYCKSDNIYWVNEVICMDIKTQKIRSVYKESNKKYVVKLVKPENQEEIFIIRTSAIYQDVGVIKNKHVSWFKRGFGTKKPLDIDTLAYDSYFISNKITKNASGPTKIDYPDGWRLVDAIKNLTGYLFILTQDTFHSLWQYTTNWERINKKQRVCEIKFSLLASKIIIGYPNKPDSVYRYNPQVKSLELEKHLNGKTYQIQYGKTDVSSRMPVPWFSIQSSDKPKAVVICGYGSYGMPLKKFQQRLWLPWLEQNYMICNLCVRGGGENGDMWWDASRTAPRRNVGISDFVNGVEFIQSKFGFSNKNTVIYGRSAGGLLVTAASYQLLDKISVVYAAKPYTDVLRTTTNLKEPQTISETDEFGLAYSNIIDFYETVKISPYENITTVPKNPAVLLTGGTNDTEVGPHMPLKYAKRLRDFDWKNVFCRMAIGEGHFTDKNKENGEAIDAIICESQLDI